MLIGSLRSVQFPGQLRRVRRQAPGRLRLAEQQQGSASDRPILGHVGTVQKRGQRPVHHLVCIEAVGVLLGKGLPGLAQCCFIQVGKAGVGNDLRAPIGLQRLLADLIELVQPQWSAAFPCTSVVMSLPGDRNATWCGRNLEQDHAPGRMLQNMDLAKGDARFRTLGDLALLALQTFRVQTVVRPHHGTELVVHAKHQPGPVHPAQVGLVAQRREILADLVGVIVVAGLLELHYLVFPGGNESIEQGRKRRLIHARPLRCTSLRWTARAT